MQARDFGDSGSGVVERGEHHPVALPAPGGAIRGIEDGLHLSTGEKAQHGLIAPFHRYRECALDHGQCSGFPSCHEMQERADRRQPGVTAADGIVPLCFQMIEESHDQWRVQIGNHEVFGCLLEVPLSEL